MTNTGPTVCTLFSAYWGFNHDVCLVNNHEILLLGLAFITRTGMILVQSAVLVGAGTLELEQFTLTDPQYGEQTLYTRAVRLVRLSLFGSHVRHSLYSF